MPTRRLAARLVHDLRRELAGLRAAEGLADDLLAGVSVAAVGIPMSMAIALASDLAPIHGLVAAAVGGVLAACFGSARLSITGPAAALAVLAGQLVDAHGLAGLALITLLAGAMQLSVGLVGFGAIARLVPSSVVHGLTAGIGVVILVGQLPRAFGLPSPDESHAFAVLGHVGSLLHQVDAAAVGLAAIVLVPMLVGPRISPRVPYAFVGVFGATALSVVLDLDVARVGALTPDLSMALPNLAPLRELPKLVGGAFALFALASLETLLSIAALEQQRVGETHDPNHEIAGQGLANLASALLSGMPVSGVYARTQLNAHARARTRRAAMLQASLVGLSIPLAAPLLERIPVATLGAVLLALGVRMLDLAYLRELMRNHRSDALVFVVTASVMVASDLVLGMQAGIVAACVVTLLRLTRTSVRFVPAHGNHPHHVLVDGTLTFLSIPKIDALAHWLAEADPASNCIVDVRHVDGIDESIAGHLCAALGAYARRGGKVVLVGPRADVAAALSSRLGPRVAIALTDADVDAQLGRLRSDSAKQRLADGLARYRREVRPRIHPLASRLAAGQSPHTMLLTCADSRVVPSLITGAGPGELFVVRNIGALLPEFGSDTLNDEGAALEYAIRVLGVRNVIVCGHGKCGAMTALCRGHVPDDLGALQNWARGAKAIAGVDPNDDDVDEVTKRVVLRQLENLRTYPVVAEGLGADEVSIGAWFYDVEAADVLEWNPTTAEWTSLTR